MALSEEKIKKLQFLSNIAIFVGLLVITVSANNIITLTKDNINTVKGTLKSYVFQDGSRGRHYYYLYLNEYTDGYQISASLLNNFYKNEFIQLLKPNDSIELSFVSQPDISFFENSKIISFPKRKALLSIKARTFYFLNMQTSFDKLKNESTIMGVVFLFVMSGGIYGKLKLKPNTAA